MCAVVAVRLDRIAGPSREARAVGVVLADLGAAIAAACGRAILQHGCSKGPVVTVAHLPKT